MSDTILIAYLDRTRVALAATDIGSVIELNEIVPVPHAPDFIIGLTAVRSQPMTVIDCRRALGLSPVQIEPGSRAVVVKIEGHQYALLFERIDDVISVDFEPTPVEPGVGKAWQRIANGSLETSVGPALMLDPATLVTYPTAQAA